MRSYSFKINIDNLKIFVNLLDDRFNALRNICNIISIIGIKEINTQTTDIQTTNIQTNNTNNMIIIDSNNDSIIR